MADRDPERAARHVAYELGMIRTIFEAISPDDPILAVNLEGFLLHARNLIEFFFDGAVTRGILPKDFGAPAARDKDDEMKELRDEISQLVSHLTWERVTVHELRGQDWSYDRLSSIYEGIRSKAQAFFSAIPGEGHEWFSTDDFPAESRNWTC